MRTLITLSIIVLSILLSSCSKEQQGVTDSEDTQQGEEGDNLSSESVYGVNYNIGNVVVTPFDVVLDINIDIDSSMDQEWVMAYKLYQDEYSDELFKSDAQFGDATYITQSGSYSTPESLLKPQTSYTLAVEAFKRIDFLHEGEDGQEDILQPYLLMGRIYTSSGATPAASVGESMMTLTPTVVSETTTSRTLSFDNGFGDFVGCIVGYLPTSELEGNYSGSIEQYIEQSDWLNSQECSVVDFRCEQSGEPIALPSYTLDALSSGVSYTIYTIPITAAHTLGSIMTLQS